MAKRRLYSKSLAQIRIIGKISQPFKQMAIRALQMSGMDFDRECSTISTQMIKDLESFKVKYVFKLSE